jgi:hypothetical protein
MKKSKEIRENQRKKIWTFFLNPHDPLIHLKKEDVGKVVVMFEKIIVSQKNINKFQLLE